MAVKQQLTIRQSQTLTMTPQMQMAIKLLQLSNLELKELVDQELEINPLLESDTSEADAPLEKKEREELDFTESSSEDMENSSYENVFQDGIPTSSSGGSFDEESLSFENYTASAVSLQDKLYQQFSHETTHDPCLQAIGYDLIHNLSAAGYVENSLEDTAERLGVELTLVEDALEILQEIAPPGVGARDLKECLLLQLMHKRALTPTKQIVLDNLHLVADRNVSELSRLTGLSSQDVIHVIKEIRSLDPRPGHDVDAGAPQTLVPDVIIKKINEGWFVQLNTETLPRALANETYYTHVKSNSRSREEKEYLTQKWSDATWLVKAMDQRANTILKVAEELVRQQNDFLEYGIKFLRPIILKDIAEKIEMHESTVSRVTTGKYIATPRGIFELRFFFTTAINSNTGGDAHSSSYIRERIKELIDKEPHQKPISDEKLVDFLAEDGIDVARRTVTKYREAMNIPSSFQRKRFKSI